MSKKIIVVLTLIFCLAFANISMAATNLTDISSTKYEEAVNKLVESNVISGYPDNTFRPDGTITRAEITKMIITAIEKESGDPLVNVSFSDIDNSNHWAKQNIYAAASLEIVSGYPDGTFRPDNNVTYAEATTMIARAMGDDEKIKESTEKWPNNYISYAQSLNLYEGIDSFDVDANATRGNVALLLWNMMKVNNLQGDNLEKGNNVLVAYFSRSGNTEKMANIIHEQVGGDLFKIETVKSYPDDYTKTTEVAQDEQNANARPELSNHIENIDKYDTIFVGYPIWWGTSPMAVFTFLEEYDFEGKTIIPFCTHGGSGLGRSVSDIRKTLSSSTVLNGLAISGSSISSSSSNENIKSWIENLGI